MIEAMADVALEAGQTAAVNVNAFDPEGQPLTVSVFSDNPGVADVTQDPGVPTALTVSGFAEGFATVTPIPYIIPCRLPLPRQKSRVTTHSPRRR